MDILELYKSAGAYLEGHFLLVSGKHSEFFLQSTTVTQHPKYCDAIGEAIAESLPKDLGAQFVLGPAMGGVTLAFAVARALNVRALFAEKDGRGGMFVRDAFTIEPGERFLAVEDVVTTGGSLMKAVRGAEARGASCVGLASIVDRGKFKLAEGLPYVTLLELDFPAYDPDTCPLCQAGITLEKV